MSYELSEQQISDILISISGKSGEVRLPCPGCDRGPDDKALSINIDKGVYTCHRCGAKGRIATSSGKPANTSQKSQPAKKSSKIDYCINHSTPADDSHPYLQKKGIEAPAGIRVYDGLLLVQLTKLGKEKIQGLQFIQSDGTKKLATGSKKRGACFIIGEVTRKTEIVCLAEGLSTAASIYQSMSEALPVIMCVDAGNLKPVAVELRKLFPKIKIVFCADNDRHHPVDNPGYDVGYLKAAAAAKAVSGSVVMPPTDGMDFNDLHQAEGLEAVKSVILAGVDPGPGKKKGSSESNNNDGRPEIKLLQGGVSQSVDMIESLLLNMNAPFYALNGQHLVRPVIRPSEKWEPTPALEPVSVTFLIDRLSRHFNFLKYDGRSDAWVSKDCPKQVAEILLARCGIWKFPSLLGLGNNPTIRPDGSLITKSGYDHQTQYYFHYNQKFPEIHPNPSHEDAAAALKRLRVAISTYRFADEVSESTAVAALITCVIRAALDRIPFILISSPVAGSGKSQQVDGFSVVATGAPAQTINAESSNEELIALLNSMMLEGAPIINLDNLTKPTTSAHLCQVLTQPFITVRIKGFSKTVTVSPRFVLFGTGNNASVQGDLARRTVTIMIDPGCERPQDRKFEMSFPDYCLKHRSELVTAALTIVRAYTAAGCPETKLSSTGSFEMWSKWVRQPLVWLGMPDPWQSQEKLTSQDETLQNLIAVLAAWYDVFGSFPKTAKKAIAKCNELINDDQIDALKDALETVAVAKNGGIDSRRLGHFLRKNQNRIVGGYSIKANGEEHRAICWQVTRIGDSLVDPETDPLLTDFENNPEVYTYDSFE